MDGRTAAQLSEVVTLQRFLVITGNGQLSEVTVTTANGHPPAGPSRHPQAAVVSPHCAVIVCVMMQKLESQTEVAKVFQMGDTGKALVEATPTLTCQPLLRHESEVKCQHQSC